MSRRRLIVAPPALAVTAGETIELTPEVAHYARDVLRLRAGAELELCDGAGRIAQARLVEGARRTLRAELAAIEDVPPPVGPAITLIQAIGKGDKVDDVFRAATELGARRLVPVRTARAVADRSGRQARWRTIAEDAIRVSGRAWLPEVAPIVGLDQVLAEPVDGLAIALDGGGERSLRAVLAEAGPVAAVRVLVGPEGGFEDAERDAIAAAGWARVSLGSHTLRTETAGAAIVAILSYALDG